MLEVRPKSIWGITHQQRFSVDFSYPVVFTRDAFNPDNPILIDLLRDREPDKQHRAAFFIDEGVDAALPDLEAHIHRYAATHHDSLHITGDIVRVPGGEQVKNDPEILSRLLRALASCSIDRHSFAIAIGGGAVLDAVGYASAIFHRGVRHIRFPTTVLGQDDSGVGVKNAVNALGLKNLIGTFAPPFAVVNDSAFIDTLPEREKRCGMAEAVKVALIRDRAFFEWLEQNAPALACFQRDLLDILIQRSAALHMHQIAKGGDPFETGSARPLDYGHWAAHKLETLTHHDLNHGEAVAIGVALDARYSVLAGYLAEGADQRVYKVLHELGFPLWHDALIARRSDGDLVVLAGLREFQEHLGGELTITLLTEIGRDVEVHAMKESLIEQAIHWLHQQQG